MPDLRLCEQIRPKKGTEGIKGYAYLKGLLPRLGFFVGHESRIPYDYNGILASIAPRPLLVIAPEWDEDATLKDVKECVNQTKEVYQLYKEPNNIQLNTPFDYSRFSKKMQRQVLQWYQKLNQSDTTTKPGTWEVLFNGKNTDEWRGVKDTTFPNNAWTVKNGHLFVKDSGSKESIMTKETYSNFVLKFDFKLTYGANSGIKYDVNHIKNNKTGKELWNGSFFDKLT